MAISQLLQPNQTDTQKSSTYDRILSQLSLLQRGHENIHITYNQTTNIAVLKDGSTYEVNGNMYVNEGDLTLVSPPNFGTNDSTDRMYHLRTNGTGFSWSADTGARFNLSNISSKGGWYANDGERIFSSFVYVSRRKITTLEKFISHTADLPIGTKIVRYRGQSEPMLGGFLGTWENRSRSEHGGLFFRCEGTTGFSNTPEGVVQHTADNFNSTIQRDMMIDFSKDSSDANSFFPTIGTGNTANDWKGVFTRAGIGTIGSFTETPSQLFRATLDLSENIDARRLGDEVRPVNQTIQIWERTA